jgi:hypothetical protein
LKPTRSRVLNTVAGTPKNRDHELLGAGIPVDIDLRVTYAALGDFRGSEFAFIQPHE